MDFSRYILETFDPIKKFKSFKAVNKIPVDFKSHESNLGIIQHVTIVALKLGKCYSSADIN